MNNQAPLLTMVAQSGPVALIDLAILLLLSVVSFGIILQKFLSKKKEKNQIRSWFRVMEGPLSLGEVRKYTQEMEESSFSRIARSAINEIEGLAPYVSYQSFGPRTQLIEEAIGRIIDKEKYQSDKHLGFLAMCSSVAPFLGLFGTVWGIMHSFLDIGLLGSANITVVAPGIAEALVTTIVGLFVAIPSSAAYNYFVNENKKLEAMMYDFGSELVALFKRGELRVLEENDQPKGV